MSTDPNKTSGMHSNNNTIEHILTNMPEEHIISILEDSDSSIIDQWLIFINQSIRIFNQQIDSIQLYLKEPTESSAITDFIIDAMILRLFFLMEMLVEYQHVGLILETFLRNRQDCIIYG
jgi:hypothetical protein